MVRMEVGKPVKRPEEDMVASQGEEIPESAGCMGSLAEGIENGKARNVGLVGTVC